MTNISLTGTLICKNDEEIAVVAALLHEHIELTRGEPGCISFEVNQSDDPRIWTVAELFQNAESFAQHQTRVQTSVWGRATAGIERSYIVTGLS